MARNKKQGSGQEPGSIIMRIVESIAISPEDAREIVRQYDAQARAKHPNGSNEKVKKMVANKIIKRYSKLAATSGGVTSLAGVIPGVGTAISMVGGGLADVSLSMKFQIDMTMCLAMALKDQLANEDAKHMSFIIALCGALEKAGAAEGARIASKAGVKMVEQYLKGATLTFIKELFKAVGIKFTKAATVKAIPFGVGVIIGSSAGYAMTQYVGKSARNFFLLDDELN
ncbi:hypothetical protein [Burkholderia gladioli]|uniref:hypothetical protein n=1 Tax=Burkholderia gladioli TaxID=28095 RepID=UPI0016413667|nr:hypothetical protein [Burkholderia gladioli]